MDAPLPTTLDGFTPTWLTAALRGTETIGALTSVLSADLTVLGAGEGFVGEIGRLDLVYQGPPGPATMIAKIPTTVAENRALGQLLGVYEREVRGYGDLLSTLDIPAPEVHLAAVATGSDGRAQLAKMKKVDHLPIWLIRRVLRGEAKRLETPPAVLLLEDLTPFETGNQLHGCDAVRAAVAMRVAARCHASTWGARLPPQRHWLQPGDVVARLFHASFLNSRKGFVQIARPHFSDRSMNLIARVRRDGLARVRTLHQHTPRCVLHGDYRLDNMFFRADGSIRAVIDWQIPNLGPGVLDIAYFLAGSLSPETPESDIDELLAVYHTALVDAGVDDYRLDRLRSDYNEALMVLLYRFAGLESMKFGDDRGPRLIQVWLQRLDARLARIPA